MAGGPGGQWDVPRPHLAEPRSQEVPDPLEARDPAQPAARGGEHHLQGEGGRSLVTQRAELLYPQLYRRFSSRFQVRFVLFLGSLKCHSVHLGALCQAWHCAGEVYSSLTLSDHDRPGDVWLRGQWMTDALMLGLLHAAVTKSIPCTGDASRQQKPEMVSGITAETPRETQCTILCGWYLTCTFRACIFMHLFLSSPFNGKSY